MKYKIIYYSNKVKTEKILIGIKEVKTDQNFVVFVDEKNVEYEWYKPSVLKYEKLTD